MGVQFATMYAEVKAASLALPWIPVAAAIAGVTLGWILSRIPANRERRRKATGFFRGIDSEIDYVTKHARIYVNGEDGKRILAPVYRMPTRFATDGTIWLAGEGFIEKGAIKALLAYVTGAEEFNRCLEEVAALSGEKRALAVTRGVDDAELERFTADLLSRSGAVNRATLKAQNLCTGSPAEGVAITAQVKIRAAAKRARLQLTD